ncbi:MAG: hypothetical protein ACREX8_08210 [Gammaproteobacteria bacterium]
MEQQPSVAQVGNEHREWHGSMRPDAAPDAQLRWLAVAVTLVIGVPACKAVLMLHVFLARLGSVFHGRHPGPGILGRWQRAGAVPRGTHELSVQTRPWGHGESQSDRLLW